MKCLLQSAGLFFCFSLQAFGEVHFRPSPEGEIVSDMEIDLAELPKFEWAVDPFLRVPGLIQPPPEEVEFKLQAVTIDGEESLAVVNDRVVRVGERVGGRTVLKIGKDFVLLGDHGSVLEAALVEEKARTPQPKRAPASDVPEGDGQVKIEEVKK